MMTRVSHHPDHEDSRGSILCNSRGFRDSSRCLTQTNGFSPRLSGEAAQDLAPLAAEK